MESSAASSCVAEDIISGSPLSERSTDAAAPPLFRVAVISDVQHADVDDGASYMGTPRFYRNALVSLRDSVETWRSLDNLSCVLHMGDILDSLQAAQGREASEAALLRVLSSFEVLSTPHGVHHCIGNHCLFNLPRHRLQELLGTPACEEADGAAFYSFSPAAGYRVVVLDSYDVSVLGWPQGDVRQLAALGLLEVKNPANANKNSPEGLEGPDRRFVAFGGGCSPRQVAWLKRTLRAADANRERVFVALHTPLHPSSSPPVCLLWNYEEVLAVLAASSCVVCTLAGHAHGGGYACDEAGVHHLVLPAVLECPPGETAFGHLDVYAHGFQLRGSGRMASTEVLPYRPWDSEEPVIV